jgi:hypothetical protein
MESITRKTLKRETSPKFGNGFQNNERPDLFRDQSARAALPRTVI